MTQTHLRDAAIALDRESRRSNYEHTVAGRAVELIQAMSTVLSNPAHSDQSQNLESIRVRTQKLVRFAVRCESRPDNC